LLDKLFRPRSIAVIGASADTGKAGGRVVSNLVRSGYKGRLYPINRGGARVEGLAAYTSILEVPQTPDLAVVVIPAEQVSQALDEAGQRGTRVAFVGVSGFAEVSERGRELQDDMLATIRRYGMRLCGPNCNGVYNVVDGIPIGYNSSHAETLPPGRAAMLAHSSAMLGLLAFRARRWHLGLSYLAGLGNEADWNMCDYLEFCIEDERTQAIGLLMESLSDGQRFLELADQARRLGKHVVALKLGRSEPSKLAVTAHSARMAGTAEAYEAAFSQAGVVSVDSVEAFVGALHMLTSQPPIGRGRLMLVTSTGG